MVKVFGLERQVASASVTSSSYSPWSCRTTFRLYLRLVLRSSSDHRPLADLEGEIGVVGVEDVICPCRCGMLDQDHECQPPGHRPGAAAPGPATSRGGRRLRTGAAATGFGERRTRSPDGPVLTDIVALSPSCCSGQLLLQGLQDLDHLAGRGRCRLAGSFSSSLITRSDSSGGTSGFDVTGGGGSCMATAISVDTVSLPLNGCWPVAQAIEDHAQAEQVAAGVHGFAAPCSGAM